MKFPLLLLALTCLGTPVLACAAHEQPAPQRVSALELEDIAPAAGHEGFHVHGQAYAYQSAPSQKTGAVFMSLMNGTDAKVSVVSAASDIAERVEIHTMRTNENGVMEMRRLDSLDIDAGASHDLKPMGDHVMLIGLKKPLEVGAEFPVTLTLSDGRTLDTSVKVVEIGATPDGDGHQH